MNGELLIGSSSHGFFDGDDANSSLDLTQTYYDTGGVLHQAPGGNTQITATGNYTNFPLALLPDSAFGFAYNTKCLFYSFASTSGISTGNFGGFAYTGSGDTHSGIGMAARVIGDLSTSGKYKFRSISGNPGSRNTVDEVIFDFTKAFYRRSNDAYGLTNYYWFPEVSLNINGFQVGGQGDLPVNFSNFSPTILATVNVTYPGEGGLGSSGFDASVIAVELFNAIYITQNRAGVGDTITVVCPANVPAYDYPGMRAAFDDLYSITFSGAPPVTSFTRVQNANKVNYGVQVRVPVGAVTGNVQLTWIYNLANAANTTDIYAVNQPLIITS